MTRCSELADFEWLTGSAAGELLAELAGDQTPLHTAVARLRGRLSPSQTHLLLEQVELRQRATAKFTQAARMFFTRTGLEQATDEWIARYKASRFTPQRAGSSPTPAAPPTIADLCCGIGGDLMALSTASSAIGIDLDPVSAHFAALNASAQVRIENAAEFDFSGIDAWHIDPDRRPGTRHGSRVGRRTTSLEHCQPDGATIDRLLARLPHAAIKLAPATKPPTHWADCSELEWISRDRECRQLVAWHGNLALAPGQRRATIVSSTPRELQHAPNSTACGLAPRSITGQPNHPIPIATRPDRYIFDTDPAIRAAHLTGVLAAEHDLAALAPGPTYLTGPRPITDAALACFEVADVLPFRTRDLAQHLRARGIGQLEIKTRGVEADPDKLRRDLKLSGSNTATLLITKIASRPVAILAHRAAE